MRRMFLALFQFTRARLSSLTQRFWSCRDSSVRRRVVISRRRVVVSRRRVVVSRRRVVVSRRWVVVKLYCRLTPSSWTWQIIWINYARTHGTQWSIWPCHCSSWLRLRPWWGQYLTMRQEVSRKFLLYDGKFSILFHTIRVQRPLFFPLL